MKTRCLLGLTWLATALLLGGCWEKTKEEAGNRRAAARWQSLLAAEAIEKAGGMPEAWDIGLFLSLPMLNDAAERLAGVKLSYSGDDQRLKGAEIFVDSIKLETRPGELLATVRATLTGLNSNAKIGAVVTCAVRYVGMVPADANTSLARFRVEPTDVSGKAKLFLPLGKVNEGSDTAKLIADLILNAQDEDKLTFDLPVPAALAGTFDVNQEMTMPLGDAQLTVSATLPASSFTLPVNAVVMLPRDGGIWLASGPVTKPKSPVPAGTAFGPDMEEIRKLLTNSKSPLANQPLPATKADLLATLDGISKSLSGPFNQGPGVNGTMRIFISKRLIEASLAQFSNLPAPQRTLVVRGKSSVGRIADKRFRDDVLGDGGVFVEIEDATNVNASLELSLANSKWSDRGFSGSLGYNVKAEIPVHGHLDPLIGGGIGGRVKIVGSSSAAVALSLQPKMLVQGTVRAAVLEPAIGCQEVSLSATTDGEWHWDGGWFSVPKLGVKIRRPLVSTQPPAIQIIQTRLLMHQLAGEKESEQKPWAIQRRTQVLALKIDPRECKATNDGLIVDAAVEMVSSPKVDAAGKSASDQVHEINEKSRLIIAEAAKALAKSSTCDSKPYTDVVFGDFKFGRNNDIFRFLSDLIGAGKKVSDAARGFVEQRGRELKAAEDAAKAAAENAKRELAALAERGRVEAERIRKQAEDEYNRAHQEFRKRTGLPW